MTQKHIAAIEARLDDMHWTVKDDIRDLLAENKKMRAALKKNALIHVTVFEEFEHRSPENSKMQFIFRGWAELNRDILKELDAE